jgi:hypothetical protein
MTPKLKAKELIEKFKPHSHFWVHDLGRQKDYDIEQLENAKQCALIAVDEIFEHINYIFQELEKDKLPNKFDDEIEYWNEVKKEIELL